MPKGYHVFTSRTYSNWLGTRGFLMNGDLKPAVANFKECLRIYALAQGRSPLVTRFINVPGKEFNTVHAMDFSFFEEVNQVMQEEPNEAMDPKTLGLLVSIGSEKGQPFAPDERMKKILTDPPLLL